MYDACDSVALHSIQHSLYVKETEPLQHLYDVILDKRLQEVVL